MMSTESVLCKYINWICIHNWIVFYHLFLGLPRGYFTFRFFDQNFTQISSPSTPPNWVPVQSRSRKAAVTVLQMPDAVDTVTWTPDDGWRYQPKHVEQFTDINKLYIVASCWTIIGLELHFWKPHSTNVRHIISRSTKGLLHESSTQPVFRRLALRPRNSQFVAVYGNIIT
jgi:hypothetical protein